MNLEIITNNVPRDLLYPYELSEIRIGKTLVTMKKIGNEQSRRETLLLNIKIMFILLLIL